MVNNTFLFQESPLPQPQGSTEYVRLGKMGQFVTGWAQFYWRKVIGNTGNGTRALFLFPIPPPLFPLRQKKVADLKDQLHYLRLEAPPGFEPGIKALQASALPLGDGADNFGILVIWVMDVKLPQIHADLWNSNR